MSLASPAWAYNRFIQARPQLHGAAQYGQRTRITAIFNVSWTSAMAMHVFLSNLLESNAVASGVDSMLLCGNFQNALKDIPRTSAVHAILPLFCIVWPSLTADIRNNPLLKSTDAEDTVVLGTALQDATYTEVRWGRLTLLFLCEVLTLTLMVLTIVITVRSGTPVWNTSLLPALLLGPGGSLGDSESHYQKKGVALSSPSTLKGMESLVRRRKVRPMKDEESGHALQ
jgi:hypothetical protein